MGRDVAAVTAQLTRLIGYLVVMAVLAVSRPTSAATPVYVDTNDLCAGLTPCFTTIQAGVNNAGPPPAEVNVFPGDYDEVDLSLMGSAIAGSPGNIVLRTVNGVGMPTFGTASITPAAGPAIHNSVSPFPDDITVEGFIVQSPDASAIALGTILGTLTLRGVVADGNANFGLDANITGGDLHISDSSFDENAGDGIQGTGMPLNVIFERVTADRNTFVGARFAVSGTVEISDSSFANNTTGEGLLFFTPTEVRFSNVTADGNGDDGASFAVAGPVWIRDSSFSNNVSNGLRFATATEVEFEDLTADGNGGDGAGFGVAGPVRIRQSSFSDNKAGGAGGGLSFSTATDVVLTDVTADRNAFTGAIFSVGQTVRVSNSRFRNNEAGEGLLFSTATDVDFANVIADGNGDDGASFGIDGDLTVTSSSFSRNTVSGLSFVGAASMTLAGVIAEGNSRAGLMGAAQRGRVTGSRFAGNGTEGVRLDPIPTFGMFQFTCNDIAENTTGFSLLAAATVDAARNFWGSETGPNHPTNPTGTGNPIIDGANGGFGTVIFQPFLAAPVAESAFCSPRGAPAVGWTGLALLALTLFVLPAWLLYQKPQMNPDQHR